MFEDNGNKCGKCQNHDYEVLKKGHARDCPFKKCECLKCRLLDARSDILQVISGKETKLKGTKKDPNCGFCQNHGIRILRKGHVRSCGFGQERHFRLDNCFDCEVHYIRNEVNRLQIKMRRAMKEDRTLSEEQRKTAREAITRDEVEKVCEMARLARRKRGVISTRQTPGSESTSTAGGGPADLAEPDQEAEPEPDASSLVAFHQQTAACVWRPWSQQQQQQIVAAIAVQQNQQQHIVKQEQEQQQHQIQRAHVQQRIVQQQQQQQHRIQRAHIQQHIQQHIVQQQQQQQHVAALGLPMAATRAPPQSPRSNALVVATGNSFVGNVGCLPAPPEAQMGCQQREDPHEVVEQPVPMAPERTVQEQQVFNALFRLLVAQFAQQNRRLNPS